MALIKCPECNTDVSDSAAVCMRCGFAINKPVAQQGYTQSVIPPKSPGVAAVLNFVWSGVGNIYIGQMNKGVIISAIYLILISIYIGLMINDMKAHRVAQYTHAISSVFGSSSGTPSFPYYSGGTIFFGLATMIFWGIMLFGVYNDAKAMINDGNNSKPDEILTIGSEKTIRGQLTRQNKRNIYGIVLTQLGKLIINVTTDDEVGLPHFESYVNVLDANGKKINESGRFEFPYNREMNLEEPGTYYIEIKSSQTGAYYLTVQY